MNIHQHAEQLRRDLGDEDSIQVKIAIFGQPGAGKSSLINLLMGQKVAEVGVETDKTVSAQAYHDAARRLDFVDLPGYGTSRFPKEGYDAQFKLSEFDLFLCVTSGKMHQADTEFFQLLSNKGKHCVFVANKHDDMWEDGVAIEELQRRKREDISKHVGRQVRVVFTSCRKRTGLDELNQAIAELIQPAKRDHWRRKAMAFTAIDLQQKHEACEKYVVLAALASAGNGLNPIPGADIAVDLSIMYGLFREIRSDYGLDDAKLRRLEKSIVPKAGKMAADLLIQSSKDGLVKMIKKYAGRQAAKSLAKYIPFAGQAIAAGLGYAITSSMGSSYLEECHTLAETILHEKLEL